MSGDPVQSNDVSFRHGFAALHSEFDYTVNADQYRGQLPEAVRGHLFRIGPGRNALQDMPFGHWFDGDGMVHRLTFTEHGTRYQNRYVQTPKYRDETAAQSIVHRSFGHNVPGGWRYNLGKLPQNCANTNVMHFNGELLALWEGGAPYALDPDTLETLGEQRFDGAIKRWHAFSAHPHVDPVSGDVFNHGVAMDVRGSALHLYRLDAQGRQRQHRRIPLKRYLFIHDSVFCGEYWVFFLHPLGLRSMLPMLAGTQTLAEGICYQPEWGMQALIVEVKTLNVVKRVPLDPAVIIHTGNGFVEQGAIVVDVLRYADFEFAEAFKTVAVERASSASSKAGTLYRYRFPLNHDAAMQAPIDAQAAPGDFPCWDGRYSSQPTRWLFTAAQSPQGSGDYFDCLQRTDTESGHSVQCVMGRQRFVSEPVFIPKEPWGEEGEGYLCAIVYDAGKHQSEVVIHDALDAQLKEVCAIPLRHHIPHGFHGQFYPTVS